MSLRSVGRREKGFSLVELLLVLAVIAGAAVLAFVAYPKVKANQAAAAETTNIAVLQAGVKNTFQSRSSFTGLSNNVLLSAQAVPNQMISSVDPEILNSWGGQVTVTPAQLNNADDAYDIKYTKVPQAECSKMATGPGTNFSKVLINSNAVKNPGDTSVDVANSTVYCKQGGNDNTLEFFGQ